MALGDVLLQKDKTVESVIRENLAAAFSQAGYQVLDSGSDNISPLTVDVTIKEFWAWFRPGFWALTLSTNIVTDLKFSNAENPITIEIHAQDSRQMATDKAWVEIVEKALEQYRLETGNVMKKPEVLVERPR